MAKKDLNQCTKNSSGTDCYGALCGIATQEFDDAVRLTATLCNVEKAGIALTQGTTLCLLSQIGITEERCGFVCAFCEVNLANEGIVEVSDAVTDPRFAQSPLVCGAERVRFYAGYPLHSSAGNQIGVLFVMSTEPTTLTQLQRQGLEQMSRIVSQMLNAVSLSESTFSSPELSENALASIREALVKLNREGFIESAGKNFGEWVGRPVSALLGQPFSSLVYPNWDVIQGEVFRDASDTFFRGVKRIEVLQPNGGRLPVEARCFAMHDNLTQTPSLIVVMRDNMDRIVVMDSLTKSEEKYRLLFENMTNGFSLHEIICNETGDPVDYRFIDVNPAFERLTRAKYQDVVGKTIKEVMPETEQHWIDVFGKVALTGEPIVYENYARVIGRYFETCCFSPKIGQFAVIFSDITERTELEAELKRNERRLSDAVNAATDGVWEWNSATGESYQSPRWYQMLGYEPNDFPMSFGAWQSLTHPDDYDKAMEGINRAINAPQSGGFESEFRMKHKDGTWRWILRRGAAVGRDKNGVGTTIAGTNVDITDRKLAEEALQHLNESLERRVEQRTLDLAERNKDLELFSYAVSHDLKAPLRAILAYGNMLQESNLSSEEAGFLARIRINAKQMADMFEAILDFSRIGSRVPKPSAVNLRESVSLTLSQLENDPQWAKTETFIDVEEANAEIDGDVLSLCIRNLLQNAFKFSAGVERPMVRVTGLTVGQEYVIKVEDNGVGFDMAYANKIFEIFHRLDPAGRTGTGIGLALVSRGLTKLGGSINAQSQIGIGSTFTVTIPLKPLLELPLQGPIR